MEGKGLTAVGFILVRGCLSGVAGAWLRMGVWKVMAGGGGVDLAVAVCTCNQ